MLNEGILTNDDTVLVKSEIIRQLRALESTTPDQLEQAVFTALTGARRSDVDWEFEDNQKGYYLWIKSFDDLLQDLVTDGYVLVEKGEQGKVLAAAAVDTDFDASQVAYPPRG
jgi:hypothetical protein